MRGLNLGIDFKGGTAWSVQMKGGKRAKVADVRSLLDTLGFGDAKVSVLTPPGGGTDTIRVEARVIADPINTVQAALADVRPGRRRRRRGADRKLRCVHLHRQDRA